MVWCCESLSTSSTNPLCLFLPSSYRFPSLTNILIDTVTRCERCNHRIPYFLILIFVSQSSAVSRSVRDCALSTRLSWEASSMWKQGKPGISTRLASLSFCSRRRCSSTLATAWCQMRKHKDGEAYYNMEKRKYIKSNKYLNIFRPQWRWRCRMTWQMRVSLICYCRRLERDQRGEQCFIYRKILKSTFENTL